MNAEIIGRHIREYREKHKLTQKQLAEMLYVSDKTISRWERGNGLPDIDELPRIARLLGISLNELVGEPPTADTHTADSPVADPSPDGIGTAEKGGRNRRSDVFSVVISLALLVLVAVAAIVTAAGYGTFETKESTYVFEAEDALFSDSFRVEDADGASGGKVAAWLHTSGTKITFKVNASRSARAVLGLRVNRAKPFVFEDKMLLGINGMPHEVGVVPGLGFDGSTEELYYKFGEPIETDVILKKGENVITITIVDGYNLNIDCLEFTTTAKLYLALRDYDFEAEDADISGLYSVIDSEKASGGRYVGDLERDGATVNFSIASDMTAYVMMRIYINHPFDTTFESRFLLTVNGSAVTVGEAKGTGYMNGADRYTEFTSPFTVGIELKEGENAIAFTTVAGANFDRISFYTSLSLSAAKEA